MALVLICASPPLYRASLPLIVTSGGQDWRQVQTCSLEDLIVQGPLLVLTSGRCLLKNVRWASQRYASCWNAFLFIDAFNKEFHRFKDKYRSFTCKMTFFLVCTVFYVFYGLLFFINCFKNLNLMDCSTKGDICQHKMLLYHILWEDFQY